MDGDESLLKRKKTSKTTQSEDRWKMFDRSFCFADSIDLKSNGELRAFVMLMSIDDD